MNSGNVQYNTVDSLSAFWPGLQVLAGDVENAIKAHLICKVLISDFLYTVLTLSRLEFMEAAFWASRSLGYSLYASRRHTIPP